MFKKILTNKLFYLSLALSIIISLGGYNLFSQFIVDDDEQFSEDEKVTRNYKPRGLTLPPHIAYDIKAQREPDVPHAIRITWKVHPEFSGEFLIGRAKKIINSELRALNARFIDVVDAGSEPNVLDERLFPGRYEGIGSSIKSRKVGKISIVWTFS